MKRFPYLMLLKIACVAINGCVLYPVAAIAQDPSARSTWYVFMDGKQVWGTSHVQVTPQSDGKVSYVNRTRLLTELLGTPQEMTSRSSVIVGPDLAPLQIDSEITQASGSIRAFIARSVAGRSSFCAPC
ncbi:MAG TPA: hypothetical protein PKD64_12590 [Pirellulaceae bacterium]|nr:hypothetical protein [Pirellulaceae bacterium]HMO93025.1 hypothetical protein [Pirellulaceae bacterium]HMP69655.1 hypothetical protein [Pirellulaceae bacterium]